MIAFAIAFGPQKARRYLAQSFNEGETTRGWRPLVWTADHGRAEKFDSAESATRAARETVPHDAWTVVGIPARSIPGGNMGGSPIAVAA